MSDFKETLRLLSKNCRENDTLTKFACFTEEADAIDAALEYISALESASMDAIRREAWQPIETEPQWIVNDLGELGVKVGTRFYFLYKGRNIEYGNDGAAKDGVARHDDGTPMKYRIVGKREFGEVCWPMSWITAGRSEHRYTATLTFHPGLSFGKPADGEWLPLPEAPGALSQKVGDQQ